MMSVLLQFIFAIMVGVFCLYTYLEWYHARTMKKGKAVHKIHTIACMDDSTLPTVSVLLPIYNEETLLEKLLDAVCALTYPQDKLDIWVLDDSPQEGMQLAKDLVTYYNQKGVSIFYSKRTSKRGGKAGNLAHGFEKCKGELICIFDADNTPMQDFLLKTVPYFSQERLGFLQTSIQFINKDASFLTRFQAIMSGHKEIVTEGQEEKDYVALLTGSSTVWRRRCVEDFGGIRCLAHGEDIDMSVRAQLQGWKFAFASHVSTQAELPETMAIFRVQRERWARSSTQNPLRHAKKILRSKMSICKRIQAMVLLFSGSILASFYFILLMTLPMVFQTKNLGIFFHVTCSTLFIAAIVWACGCTKNNTFESSSRHKQKFSFIDTLGYVLMFFPSSLYSFYGFCYVCLCGQGTFNPTSKGKTALTAPKLNKRLLWLEIMSFFYALSGIVLSIIYENYWICFYCTLAASGFGLGLFFSWRDTWK